MSTKQCRECKETKSIDSFHKDKRSKDGHHSRCAVCNGRRSAQWRIENPKKVRETAAAWRNANRESYNERKRVYANRSPEAIEQRRERVRKWAADNPTKKAANGSARRARILDQMPADACQEQIASIYQARQDLSEFLGVELAVDHIVPLAAGGLHHQDNLQLLPAALNQSKGARTDWVSPPNVFEQVTYRTHRVGSAPC